MQETGLVGGESPARITVSSWDVACHVINQTIGWRIFISPAFVVALVENKLFATLLWLVGGFYAFSCIYTNLEYSSAWPFNGGEFVFLPRMFPRPPLVLMCSFAWFFVTFSTPAASSLVFGLHVVAHEFHRPDAWRTAYIASALILIIFWVHYALPRLGIFVNRATAAFKVLFLLVLICAGLVYLIIERHSVPFFQGFATDFGAGVPAKNKALALFLVLYNYQGWQCASYIASEVDGGEELCHIENSQFRVAALKYGAYSAVTAVTVLYLLFNIVMLWLFNFEEIIQGKYAMTVIYTVKVLSVKNHGAALFLISLCIAASALGSIVSSSYTNSRVIRKIAVKRILPFYEVFQTSSTYGESGWDKKGTPRGGLMLLTLIALTAIAASVFFHDCREVPFIIDGFFFYGHSIFAIFLGIGFLFNYNHIKTHRLQHEESASRPQSCEPQTPFPPDTPMLANSHRGNSTTQSREHLVSNDPEEPLYNLNRFESFRISMRRLREGIGLVALRILAGVLFVSGNIFIVVIPLVPTRNPDGTSRHIRTWIVPVVVISTCCVGALAALYILTICSSIKFDRGLRDGITFRHRLGWILEFPDLNFSNFWKPPHWRALWERLCLDENKLPEKNIYRAPPSNSS
ncbi:hypothetical protein K432DRAFT_404453 [Lepidopterella palustris CBS 459.81]|uniref:Amino acid transporter n=1 Tax=Lepidopterella palustris CBS 459.81 TaxID=1314670 RepID=A0A8E2EBG7_9PEZI|nr:hypothetical protein K432DRAFT_404453 [Lepidopterella palustris CBS 459.81]